MDFQHIDISKEEMELVREFVDASFSGEEKDVHSLVLDILNTRPECWDNETFNFIRSASLYAIFLKFYEHFQSYTANLYQHWFKNDNQFVFDEHDLAPYTVNTIGDFFNQICKLGDKNIKRALEMLECDSYSFDSLYYSIKNNDEDRFLSVIRDAHINVAKASKWTSMCHSGMIATNMDNFEPVKKNLGEMWFDYIFPNMSIEELGKITSNLNDATEEDKNKLINYYSSSIAFYKGIIDWWTEKDCPIFEKKNIKKTCKPFYALTSYISPTDIASLATENSDLEKMIKGTLGIVVSLSEDCYTSNIDESKAASIDNQEEYINDSPVLVGQKKLKDPFFQDIVCKRLLSGWFSNSVNDVEKIKAIFFGKGHLPKPNEELVFVGKIKNLVCFVSYLFGGNVDNSVWSFLNEYINDKKGNSVFKKNPSSNATMEEKQNFYKTVCDVVENACPKSNEGILKRIEEDVK